MTRLPDERFEYGVITKSGEGESVAVGIRRFDKRLRVKRRVEFDGMDWVVESVTSSIWPPIVVLAQA